MTVVDTSYDVPWPQFVHSWLSYSKLLVLDVLEVTSFKCLSSYDFYNSLLVIAIFPVCVMLLLMAYYFSARKIFSSSLTASRQKNFAVKIGFLVVTITYPGISIKVFQTFVCRRIYEHVYLVADYSLECTGTKYTVWKTIAAIIVVLVPVGIPIALAVFLYDRIERRQQRDEENSRSRYGHLYMDYVPHLYWWEVTELIRKLLLSTIVVFMQKGTPLQIICGLFIAVMFHLAHAVTHPFRDRILNAMQHAFLGIIWMTLLVALILKLNAVDSEAASSLSKTVLALYGVALLCAVFFCLAKVYRGLKQRNLIHVEPATDRKNKAGAADGASSDEDSFTSHEYDSERDDFSGDDAKSIPSHAKIRSGSMSFQSNSSLNTNLKPPSRFHHGHGHRQQRASSVGTIAEVEPSTQMGGMTSPSPRSLQWSSVQPLAGAGTRHPHPRRPIQLGSSVDGMSDTDFDQYPLSEEESPQHAYGHNHTRGHHKSDTDMEMNMETEGESPQHYHYPRPDSHASHRSGSPSFHLPSINLPKHPLHASIPSISLNHTNNNKHQHLPTTLPVHARHPSEQEIELLRLPMRTTPIPYVEHATQATRDGDNLFISNTTSSPHHHITRASQLPPLALSGSPTTHTPSASPSPSPSHPPPPTGSTPSPGNTPQLQLLYPSPSDAALSSFQLAAGTATGTGTGTGVTAPSMLSRGESSSRVVIHLPRHTGPIGSGISSTAMNGRPRSRSVSPSLPSRSAHFESISGHGVVRQASFTTTQRQDSDPDPDPDADEQEHQLKQDQDQDMDQQNEEEHDQQSHPYHAAPLAHSRARGVSEGEVGSSHPFHVMRNATLSSSAIAAALTSSPLAESDDENDDGAPEEC